MNLAFEWVLVSLPSGGFFLGISPRPPHTTLRSSKEILKTAGISLRPFFEAPFSEGQECLEFKEAFCLDNLEQLLQLLQKKWPLFARFENGSNREWPLVFEAASEEEFKADFLILQNKISEGLLKKAVPCTFEYSRGVFSDSANLASQKGGEAFQAWALHRLLRSFSHLKPEFQKKLNLYSLSYGQTFVMGMSPEILLSNALGSEQKTFQSVALAGSAALTRDDHEFLSDPKELAEHNWVVEDLLLRAAELQVQVEREPLRVECFPALKHLKTPLSWKVNASFDPFAAVTKLHPTAALGVLPRRLESQAILRSLRSSMSRGYLGAPLSIWDGKGLFHSLVVIRGIERRGADLALGAGCGVVEASQRDNEWQECALKRRSIKAVFGWK